MVSIFIVAALIWLFAEAQSVSERVVEIRVTILSPTGSGLFVNVDDAAWTGRASVRIQGARAAIGDAAGKLADGVPLFVGAPGIAAEPGRQVIDLRSALMANPPLDGADVTIAAVEPRTIELRIDELVRVPNIPIRASLPGVQTIGDMVIEPSTTTLVIPTRIRDELGARVNSLVVDATLPQSALRSLAESGSQRQEARLVLPESLSAEPGARLEPPAATLTFTVRSTTESVTLPSVPVWPMTPPTEFNRWRINVEPILLREIELTGPSDIMERIRSGDIRVIATIQLSSDDLDQQITSKTPVIVGLPDSVTVETRIDPVTITIEPLPVSDDDDTATQE